MEVLKMRKAKFKRPNVTASVDITESIINAGMRIVKRCIKCGEEICHERLEVLPDTNTCVKHSNAKPVAAEDLDMVTGADRDDLQKMMNGD